jgi:GNAT superfamily N-acetyltransferase
VRAVTSVRAVRDGDLADVVAMVHELAAYERAAAECTLTVDALGTALFGPAPALFGHVATALDGQVVGTALWFLSFSTWDGVHGVYLEDLYVRPAHRGRGHGRALLAALAALCVGRGYTRLAWSVLDWNASSIEFYLALGALPLNEWVGYRLTGTALLALATEGA